MKRKRQTQRREDKSPPPSNQSSQPAALILLAALVVVLIVAVYWRRRSNSEAPLADLAADHGVPPPPAPRSSRYQNTFPRAQYVGSQRCQQCHADQAASYEQTAHARSFAIVDPAAEPPDGQFDHEPSRRRFRAVRKDGKLWHSESLLLAGGGELPLVERPLKYLVGSGQFARTYLAEVNAGLVESPLSWYASPKAWRMSPGYDGPRHLSFRRDIDTDCLYCHVGRAEAAPGSLSRLTLHEMAIGCERCHGAGSIHTRRREADEGPPPGDEDLSIVNPRRLARDLNEAICNQCHLESAASAVVRGQTRESFRPGLSWNDFVANFGYKEQRENMTVTGHVEQMHASRCYQKSDSLTCTTCHDPHDFPQPDERRDHYRAICLQCHDEKACRAPASERESNNRDECAACHMPKSSVEVPHLAFTHHRIGFHSASKKAADEQVAATALVPMLDLSRFSPIDRERLLGLAYWRHHAQSDDDALLPAAHERAEDLLTRVAQSGLHDPAIAAPLAALALQRGDSALAKQEAERALADASIAPRERVLASELLAAIYVGDNRLAEASQLLKELLEIRPHPQYWCLLGICRQRQGDLAGATEAMERVLELDPAEPATYRFLARLYQARGDADAATRFVKRAELLEANLPP